MEGTGLLFPEVCTTPSYSGVPRGSRGSLSTPCPSCPLNDVGAKLPPALCVDPVLVVVSAAPTANDEREGARFSGQDGALVRGVIADAGLDVSRVAFVTLTRCRPPGDDCSSTVWETAAKRCRAYLVDDVAGPAPLLLLGVGPMRAYFGGKAKIGAMRGLWAQTAGRDAFVTYDPVAIQRAQSGELIEQFRADVRTMAERVLGVVSPDAHAVMVYESVDAAEAFLLALASRTAPWAFDIETYDAAAFPSRPGVATDACHPDFRLRGIAVALSATAGAWIDTLGADPVAVCPALSPAFGSPTAKYAYWGHFDEEGLVYPGYVAAVRNRAGDGGLALLTLSDGGHDSLRLEHAVVNVLGRRQYWNGLDKSRMRDVPLRDVARSAVGDACYTFELVESLHARLDKGEYFMHGKGGR